MMWRLPLSLLTLVIAPAVWAQDLPPETSLLPPQRAAAAPEDDAAAPPEPQIAAPAASKTPKPSPDATEEPDSTPDTPPDTPDAIAFAACTRALEGLRAEFAPIDAVEDGDDDSCGIPMPVRLETAAPGVKMRPDTILGCDAALALAKWVDRTVLPAADVLSDRGKITGLNHGSSYICRRRNNLPDGQLSEHSFGTAIDIMGVTFEDGSTLPIEPRERDGTLEEAFQDAIRAGACLSFTTVLGPRTDAHHADHLHFDVKQRNGGFRLCQ